MSNRAKILALQEELDRVTEQREQEKVNAEHWKFEAEDSRETADVWCKAWEEILAAIDRSGYVITWRPTGYEYDSEGATTATGQQMFIVKKGEEDGVR